MVASASLKGAARSSVSLRVANSRSPSAAGAEFESSLAMAPALATKGPPRTSEGSLYVPQPSAARRARLPQHVAAFARRNGARGDEQMIGQAVEIGEQMRVERFDIVQRNGRALGPPSHGSRLVQRGDGGGAARQDEAGQRLDRRVH